MKKSETVKAHNPSLTFRGWVYFRIGWANYFAFLFAATTTLVTTYFLLIQDVQLIKEIFPTFAHYVVTAVLVGVPSLIALGYIHFQRSQAFKSEADVRVESNPHARRILLNTELLLEIVFRLNNFFLRKSNNEKLTEKELREIHMIQEKIQDYKQDRTISDSKWKGLFDVTILSDIDKINMKNSELS
tara:strand:+ start:545 stop:1105 length:561 start_codon:yes stop_codon:yes gene_type:complete